VRQAFAYAIDRTAIAKLYPGGSATSNLLVAPPADESANTSFEFNPQKASALLDEAGWKVGASGYREKNGVRLHVSFQTATSAVRQATQSLIRRGLNLIGVQVDLNVIDSAVFFTSDPNSTSSLGHFYADLEEYPGGNDTPDAGRYMAAWTCAQIPQKANDWAGQNYARWCSPDYDALYQKSVREMDPEKRRLLFIQMNDLVVKNLVVIPLAHVAKVAGIGNDLTGVDLTPWDSDLWNIKDWKGN
jgi:peptide/nickel transport system substrate-binding protein